MVDVAQNTWSSAVDRQSPIQAYNATLAFADYPYYPTEQSLTSLIENLRQLKLRDKPFTHVPAVAFPAASTRAPVSAPRIVAPMKHGTF